MLFAWRNTILLPLHQVNNYLSGSSFTKFIKDIKPFWNNCGERYILKHDSVDGLYIVRMWKSNIYTSLWSNSMTSTNMVAGMNYRFDNDRVKLEYFNTPDSKITQSLIKYVENHAKEHNVNKLVLDVHNNLNRYNDEYKKYNFVLNGNRCRDNYYWVETEKIIC